MEPISDKDLNLVTDEDLGYDEIEDIAYTTEIDPYDEYMDDLIEKEIDDAN